MASKINLDNYNSFSGTDVVVTAQLAPINDGDEMKIHTLGSLQTISYSTHQDKAPVRSIGNINAIDYVMGQRTIAGTMVFAMFSQHWMVPLLEELSQYTNGTDIWTDELPPLNITINMANEYGYKSSMVLYGVKFIDDGGVMSVNDLYTENTLQYLAVGIEPLRSNGQYNHSYTNKRKSFTIVSADTSFKWKGADINNPKTPLITNPVTDPDVNPKDKTINEDSEITVDQPIVNGGNGVVNIFIPKEDEKLINIYIKDKKTNFTTPVRKKNLSGKYYSAVKEGEYVVVFENKDNKNIVESNIISVKKPQSVIEESSFPVIQEVSNAYVKFFSNNKNHDMAYIKKYTPANDEDYIEDIYESDEEPLIVPISEYTNSNKEVEIDNLESGVDYLLHTFNSATNNASEHVVFKTLSGKEEFYDIFKDYVINNRKLHINEDLINFDFNLLKSNGANLIDSVLKIEDKNIKSELLLYAEKLQNEFTKVLNDQGTNNNVYNSKEDPFKAKFIIEENVKALNVYMKSNNKNYFVSSLQLSNDCEFSGKSDTRYFIQPVLLNNKKGCVNDFVCFDANEKKLLEKYNNVGNLSKVSYLVYKNNYDKYNDELKNAIKSKDNFYVYKELIQAPSAIVSEETLHVDVNYKEFNQLKTDNYFLCLSQPEDALDYTPIRKVQFNGSQSELILSKYYTGLTKNNYYLLWIEDSEYNAISKPFILSTYKEDSDYEDYNDNEIKDYLKYMKNIFISANATFMDIFNYSYVNLVSQNGLYLKDMDYKLAKDIIDFNYYGTGNNQLDTILYNIFAVSSGDIKVDYGQVSVKNNLINFSVNKNVHMASITLDANKDFILKASHDNFTYDTSTYVNGYTLLFLVDNDTNIRSGFVLINNNTKQIYNYNIDMEVM